MTNSDALHSDFADAVDKLREASEALVKEIPACAVLGIACKKLGPDDEETRMFGQCPAGWTPRDVANMIGCWVSNFADNNNLAATDMVTLISEAIQDECDSRDLRAELHDSGVSDETIDAGLELLKRHIRE
jgi:hypothetical protein